MVKLTESTVYIRTKTSVEAVKRLNLWGCDIDDISICSRMVSLEVLSLSVNRVESLEPLKYCSKLTELYLRKNNINSLSELDYLKNLQNLRVLWMDENPCAQIHGYRNKVLKLLPQLTKLDDKAIHSHEDSENSKYDNSASDNNSSENEQTQNLQPNYISSSCSQSISARNEISTTKSLYGGAIVDTVMQPQLVHYGDNTSDDDRFSTRELLQSKMSSRTNLMTQSVYGALPEDDWGDFNVEDDLMPLTIDSLTPRMCASMHESLDRSCYRSQTNSYGRSVSVPRRRIQSRNLSTSPAREQRLSKIMSAVSVLLDELDQDGLRAVVCEAQSRMKKQK